VVPKSHVRSRGAPIELLGETRHEEAVRRNRAGAMNACMFHDARKQQKRIATEACTFEGSVVSQRASDRPLIVARALRAVAL
jgi:hypothetical protein